MLLVGDVGKTILDGVTKKFRGLGTIEAFGQGGVEVCLRIAIHVKEALHLGIILAWHEGLRSNVVCGRETLVERGASTW